MFIVPCAFIFIIFYQTNHKNHQGNYSYSIILKYKSVIQENHREIQSTCYIHSKFLNHTSKNFFEMPGLDTSRFDMYFNGRVVTIHPYPATLTAYPTLGTGP